MEGYDPKGNLYVLGLCECEVPEAIRILAIEVIKALPRVAGVACSAMLGGLNLVVDLGTTVMPGGIAVKGLKQALGSDKDSSNDRSASDSKPDDAPEERLSGPASSLPPGQRSDLPSGTSRSDSTASSPTPQSAGSTTLSTTASGSEASVTASASPASGTATATSATDSPSTSTPATNTASSTGSTSVSSSTSACPVTSATYLPAATYAVGECSENFPAFCPTEDDEDALTENLPDIDDAETVESNPEDGIEKRSPTLVKRGGARTFTVKHTAGDIAVTSVPYPKRKDFVEAVRSGNDPKIYQKVFDWSKNDKVNGVKAQIWDGIRAQSSSDFKRLLKRSAEPASHDEKNVKAQKAKADMEAKKLQDEATKEDPTANADPQQPGKGSGRKPTKTKSRKFVSKDSTELISEWLTPLRRTVGTFQYLQHREVKKRLYQEIKDVRKELAYFEAHGGPFAAGTVQIWDDFIVKLFDRIESRVRSWYATDRQTALLTFQQAKRDFENEQRRCADKNTNGKRPKQEDLPHYITYALKIIPRYQKLATKLVMRKESEIDVDFDMNFPEEVNIGEFIMAPFQPKTGADTCANVGGNLAGLLGSLGGIAAPA